MLKLSRTTDYLYFSEWHSFCHLLCILFCIIFFKWQRKIFWIFFSHYLAYVIIFGVHYSFVWFLLFFKADIFSSITQSQKPQETIWSRWMILCSIQRMHYNFFMVQLGKIFFSNYLIMTLEEGGSEVLVSLCFNNDLQSCDVWIVDGVDTLWY